MKVDERQLWEPGNDKVTEAAAWQLRGSEMPKIIKTQLGAAQEAYNINSCNITEICSLVQSSGAKLLNFGNLRLSYLYYLGNGIETLFRSRISPHWTLSPKLDLTALIFKSQETI